MVQMRVDENFAGGGALPADDVGTTSQLLGEEENGTRCPETSRQGRARAVLAGASLFTASGSGQMVSRAPTKALVLLVWARLSSTLQISARRPPVSSPPGFVRMFAAPLASTQPSVRAVLPPVPAPPGVRIRMLAAPKRGAAVDSYQTVAVLCDAASSTRPGSQPPVPPPTTLGALPRAQAALRTREECPRCMAADEEAAAALWHLPASRPILAQGSIKAAP